MTEKSSHKRLFLALWPDEVTRKKLYKIQQLFATRRQVNARPIKPENIHITLHFLGDVDEAIVEPLCTLLDTVETSAFELTIDRWGYFPRPQVLWLGAEQHPDALTKLVEATKMCIENVLPDYRSKKFVPHATLYRRARHPGTVEPFEPVSWYIDRFVLVESRTWQEGVEYRVAREWSLLP